MENNQLLLETRRAKGVLIAAHRGAVAGNVPFNTLEAFDAALLQGAHIIETDITKSRDGELFLFHPGQEHNHLNRDIHLETMTGEEIRRERYVNTDNAVTPYGLSTLDEALEHLKGRCLINLDHTWEYLPEVMQTVRRHGMRDAIILKTPGTLPLLKLVEEVAPDYMYMPIIHEADDISVVIEGMDIRYAGAELVFTSEDAPVARDAYIEDHHKKGRLLWGNAIVYDYRVQLAAGHTDDAAVTGNPDFGWGWILDKGFDILQTDWVSGLSQYIAKRKIHP